MAGRLAAALAYVVVATGQVAAAAPPAAEASAPAAALQPPEAGAVVAPEGASSAGPAGVPAVVEVRVAAAAGRIPISPYLYGRNGAISADPSLVREAGLRITRESHGNNCTKLNWRKDLSSHPDWYNNVYKQGLDERAVRIQNEFGDLQGLFGLQILGWVAKTDEYNFPWQPDPRPDPRQNLCGGGNPALYLEPWTAKDTVDLLDHWFGPGGLGLDPARFRYWHLDNEPECWPSTHDDVCPKDLSAEECVRRYAAVARELKSRYPGVRVMAPGFTSEWFWWNWADQQFVDGRPWMEHFVKRMAEEGHACGLRLLDVVDFHSYAGGDCSDADVLQEHRIFYDPNYSFPRANGCKKFPDGGWHDEQRVEMVFGRMEGWLTQYFGEGHGIGIGITEASAGRHPPMVRALWYASMLGTFADHGVEVFTPWEWHDTWWEVVHLFSRYGRAIRVEATSRDEAMVSAYASVDDAGDGMTIILVNRDPERARTASVTLAGFTPRPGAHAALTLRDLPEERTFQSHSENALQKEMLEVEGPAFALVLPPYSIRAVVLESAAAAESP